MLRLVILAALCVSVPAHPVMGPGPVEDELEVGSQLGVQARYRQGLVSAPGLHNNTRVFSRVSQPIPELKKKY